MVIYNITTKIDNSIEEEWLQWQHNVFIPDVISTGLFNDHRIFKLLEQDEADGKHIFSSFMPIIRTYASNISWNILKE